MAGLIDVPVSVDLLSFVARELRDSAPDSLTVVFPGKRAGQAFNLAWVRERKRACLAPRVTTMNGLLHEIAGVGEERMAAEADAVFFLYEVARKVLKGKVAGITGNLSSFYRWGVAWLKAMDELDREGVSGPTLRQLSEMGEIASLSDTARLFYRKLPELREGFRIRMEREALFTRGMLYDRALKRIGNGLYQPRSRTVFVGLFALFGGEVALIKALDDVSGVSIYRHHDGRRWKAFKTMEKELKLVPKNGEVNAPSVFPELEFHALPSVHGEVVCAGDILGLLKMEDPSKTAVVLPDPAPLVPLLWEAVSGLDIPYNVTMGYPLTRTPLYSLLNEVMLLAENRRDGRLRAPDYLKLLLHPYVKNLRRRPDNDGERSSEETRILVHSVEAHLKEKGMLWLEPEALENDAELLDTVERKTGGALKSTEASVALCRLRKLFVDVPSRASTVGELANALLKIVAELAEYSPAPKHPFFGNFFGKTAGCLGELAALRVADEAFGDLALLNQLFRAHFSAAAVPFTGLPLKGLQILGLLETRAQSFENVLILDANEGVLPPVGAADPVLPPIVRRALGLPGYEERVEVSRYHFMRLLSSCRGARILYREVPEAPRSRFVEELLYRYHRNSGKEEPTPKAFSFHFGRNVGEAVPPRSKAALVERLQAHSYAPTELDAYLRCPMSFYYGSVARLKEPEELSAEMDARKVGTLLHGTLALLYRPHVGEFLSTRVYDKMLAALEDVVRKVFPESGSGGLLKRVALTRLRKLLEGEKERAKKVGESKLVGVEAGLGAKMTVGDAMVAFKGRADRVEMFEQRLLVIDYKSGTAPKLPGISRVESVDGNREAVYQRLHSFQLPLYVEMIKVEKGMDNYSEIDASYLSLKKPGYGEDTLFSAGPEAAEEWMERVFKPCIKIIVGEILDPSVPFEAVPRSPALCNNCPYTVLCRKR